jgi:hypothetical protein
MLTIIFDQHSSLLRLECLNTNEIVFFSFLYQKQFKQSFKREIYCNFPFFPDTLPNVGHL